MLVLLSVVRVRILYYGEVRIIISVLCFDLILYGFNKTNNAERNVAPKNILNFIRLINKTLPKLEVEFNRLFLPDISEIQIFNGLKYSLLSLLIAYIGSKSVKIKGNEHFMQGQGLKKAEIDLTLSGRILPIGITMLRTYFVNNR